MRFKTSHTRVALKTWGSKGESVSQHVTILTAELLKKLYLVLVVCPMLNRQNKGNVNPRTGHEGPERL
jgi:hypothetical protein